MAYARLTFGDKRQKAYDEFCVNKMANDGERVANFYSFWRTHGDDRRSPFSKPARRRIFCVRRRISAFAGEFAGDVRHFRK